MSISCPICARILLALDKELCQYDDTTRIPIDAVIGIVNKVTNGKPRIVVLPKEARGEAMQIMKRKMIERQVSFSSDVAEVLSRVPKDWEPWWEHDPEKSEDLAQTMKARSFIATVWAAEKYGQGVLPIARPVPMSKSQVRQLIQTIHILHEKHV